MSSVPTIPSHTQQTKPWPAVNLISTSERLPITQPPQCNEPQGVSWKTYRNFSFSPLSIYALRGRLVRCDVDFIVRKSGEERHAFTCHTVEPSSVSNLQLQSTLRDHSPVKGGSHREDDDESDI